MYFSSDSHLLATAGVDGTIRLWNLATGEEVKQLINDALVFAIAFSQDGTLLASATWGGIMLWNPAMGRVVQHLVEYGSCYAIAFSHDRQLLASGSDSGVITLWNSVTGQKVQRLNGHGEMITAIAFSCDNQLLVPGSYDRTVRLWNPATGEELQRFQLNTTVSELWFSSDGQRLETDKGVLLIASNPSLLPSLEPMALGPIFLNGEWIVRDGQNLLWLPHDYRGSCSASKENCLVIGQESGMVTFFQFYQ
jgi:WD40 repeat protein